MPEGADDGGRIFDPDDIVEAPVRLPRVMDTVLRAVLVLPLFVAYSCQEAGAASRDAREAACPTIGTPALPFDLRAAEPVGNPRGTPPARDG